MNIFRTFEIFLSEPVSFLRKKIIRILHVESEIFEVGNFVDVSSNEDTIQLNVYNNEKVYKLLSMVMYKKKLNEKNKKLQISNKL